jgi:YVTN family beta-propeller protein
MDYIGISARLLVRSLLALSLIGASIAPAGAQNAQTGAQNGQTKDQAKGQTKEQRGREVERDRPFFTVKSVEPPTPPKAPLTISGSYQKEGVGVELSVSSVAEADGNKNGLVSGAAAIVSFRVSDTHTGEPITGLHPTAWINPRTTDHAPNEEECKDKIRAFMNGLLSVRAEIDLNQYLVLSLNHDNTIEFINPQVSFNITKLESIVVLPGPGADWVLSQKKDFLYVTLPSKSAVAVIDTITRRLVGTISTGEKTNPMRIALQPDGRYVWVGLDESPRVALIDTASNTLAKTVEVGDGLHNLAFTADSRFAYVSNTSANTVSAIDSNTLERAAEIQVGLTPVPIAYSSASRFIYAAALNGATVSVIDPAKQKMIATIPVERGVVAMRFDPDGRYGFAINQIESTATVFDASTNAIVGTYEVVKGADQITFTQGYAYVIGTESEKFSLLELNDIKTGKLAPSHIQAGRLVPSTSPDDIGVADMIVPTPEGNSVMIANAPDMMIYYYVEGMLAPMGTLNNYKRRPHGLMLIDRSLTEVAPGVYSSPIRLEKAGRFDVPMVIDQPRIVNCFQLDVAGSKEMETAAKTGSVVVESMFTERRFKPQTPVTLRFKLTDSVTKQPLSGLRDARLLVFEPPGIWQQRRWLKEVDKGVYEVTQTFPRVGLYDLLIGIESRGLRYADSPLIRVGVANETKPEDDKPARKGEKL